MKNKRKNGSILGILSINSFTISLDKLGVNELPIFLYLFIRYLLISTMTILLPGRVFKENNVRRDLSFMFNNKKTLILFLTSILLSIFSTFSYFLSYEHIPVSLMATLEFGLQLIFVTIISSVFLKEKYSFKVWFFIFLAAFSLSLIVSNGESIGNLSVLGVVFMSLYSLLAGIDMLVMKPILNKISFKTITIFKMVGCSVSALFLSLTSKEPIKESILNITVYSFLLLLLVALFSYGNRLLTSISIYENGALKTSLFLCLIPVTSSIVASLIFSEKISVIQAIGIFLSIFSIYMANRFKIKVKSKEELEDGMEL